MRWWMKWWIAGIALVLLIGGGVYLVSGRGAEEENSRETSSDTAPQRSTRTVGTASPSSGANDLPQFGGGESAGVVIAKGEVAPIHDVELRFESGGIVEMMLVERGSKVKRGETLAVLDTSKLALDLEQAQAGLDLAQAEYDALTYGATAEEIAIAEAKLRGAQAEVRRAEAEIARSQAVIRQGEARLARAGADLAQAYAQVGQADAAVAEAHAQVAGAHAQVRGADARVAGDYAQLGAAAAKIDKARAEYGRVLGEVTPLDIAAAEAKVAETHEILNDLLKGPDRVDIETGYAELDRAIADLDSLRAEKSAAKSRAREQVEIEANRLRDAQAAYSRVYWDIREIERELNTVNQEIWQQQKDREEAALRNVRNAERELAQAQINYQEAVELEESSIREAEGRVRDARARLDDILDGPKDHEIATARAAVADAESKLEHLRGDRRRASLDSAAADIRQFEAELVKSYTDLDQSIANADFLRAEADRFATNIPRSMAEAERARAAVGSAEADIAAVQADITYWEADVAMNEGSLARQRANVEQFEGELAQLRAPPKPPDVAAAQSMVDARKTDVKQAQLAIEQARLISPIDGTVVELYVKQGEWADVFSPAMLVADFSEWEIRTSNLDEMDVVLIDEGNAAKITFDAIPNLELNGKVKRIHTLGTSADDATGSVYEVIIEPLEWDPRLRWKMTATVMIETSR